ncbi:hypothetical protein CBM2586_B130554 [Cupriavidus phytorum]|uniref:Uncharacterized protein n=1 Tax=Cupriavidus taiwanensis TaxID=164546 RepID=A0A975XI84_9BURK|nr:hypothetical protein CBM2586_B130554 [Cupriavidus taiwanensis]
MKAIGHMQQPFLITSNVPCLLMRLVV